MMKILNEEIQYAHKLAPDIYRLGIRSSHIASEAVPGQFVSIRCCEGLEALLRRPISICNVLTEEDIFEIGFMVKGRGTQYLSDKKAGDKIDLIGPLGNGFKIPEDAGRIAVVGGGIGIFPLLFLLNTIDADVIKHTYLGFRNKSSAVLLDEFAKVSTKLFISSDDGTIGEKGFVTDLFLKSIPDNGYDIIFTCGPAAMMKIVVSIASERKIPCQVSMEQRMGCGIGACLACACKTRTENGGWEYSRVCSDGPVFPGEKIIF